MWSWLQVKHPGVLKVIEPLEETGGQMVMVTEPVFGSLANVLSQFREVPTAPPERVSVMLSPLEAKYGLHMLADTLHFLHHEAHLVHCNINPGERLLMGGALCSRTAALVEPAGWLSADHSTCPGSTGIAAGCVAGLVGI